MALRSTLSLAFACLVLALAAASSVSAQISPAMLVNAASAVAKGAAGAAEQVTGEPVPRNPEQALAASKAHPADSVVVSDASASLARPVVSFLKQLPFLPTEDKLVRTPNGQEVLGEDGRPMTQAALASRVLDTATSVAPICDPEPVAKRPRLPAPVVVTEPPVSVTTPPVGSSMCTVRGATACARAPRGRSSDASASITGRRPTSAGGSGMGGVAEDTTKGPRVLGRVKERLRGRCAA